MNKLIINNSLKRGDYVLYNYLGETYKGWVYEIKNETVKLMVCLNKKTLQEELLSTNICFVKKVEIPTL